MRLKFWKKDLRHRPGVVQADAIAWAIEAANKARAAGGAEKLNSDKLPYSEYVGNAHHCVLAKLFNFHCSIGPARPYSVGAKGWAAHISRDDLKAAEELARALGTKVVDLPGSTRVKVPLPEAIAQIAVAFDNRMLPSRFVQQR